MLSDPWILMHFGKVIRSFHARNVGSVGQKALNLLAFKVGGLTTPLSNGKKLSNNSTWGFEPFFDTKNPYGLCSR